MNKCVFSGNIATDLALSKTNGSKTKPSVAVLNFRLAVKSTSGKAADPTFIPVAAFGKFAETIAANFCKGSRIEIETKAIPDTYTDKNGNTRNSLMFLVTGFDFIDTKNEFETRKKKLAGEA
ncbi:MAG: single-stranded DNA-binding protein [Clostridiales bacterium]|nr:single-stranded DNA-binding protein [Clostridiales bacterium]